MSKKIDRPYHVVYPGIYVYDDPLPVVTENANVVTKEDAMRDVLPLDDKVTAITVNYKTHDLTKKCIGTFRRHHLHILHILVDNGSADESTELVRHYTDRPGYNVIINKSNVGHGPAMHQAISLVKTPYFLTLDSDTETRCSFVDKMLRMFDSNDALYAVGWLRMVDKITGVPSTWFAGQKKPPDSKFVPYLHPYCGLYRTGIYKKLMPFFDHGAPCLDNMRDANSKGYVVQQFKGIGDCVMHCEAGTRRLFSGDWHPSDRRKPNLMDKDRKFPI